MDDRQWQLVRPALVRLRASITAAVFGSVAGMVLFVSTAWLVIQGGEEVGKHLSLLSNYYPGYTVTWTGAFVGLFYGALTGTVLGYTVAWVYNVVSLRRFDGYDARQRSVAPPPAAGVSKRTVGAANKARATTSAPS
ncbi:MAG: hypothetical protein JWN48_1372 [Myxococcaceae bacterium]|nr:hypothetical protein [Myxococcaceae bacterium]